MRPLKPKSKKRFFLKALGLIGVLLLGGELFCRTYFQLGHPVLFEFEPEMEYLPQPNQNLRRFGNLVQTNRWSQRNGDVSARKTDKNERRVLILGDSIAFGGSQIDQSQICGAALEKLQKKRVGQTVRVLTAAAGSWGPQNELAYLQRFGTFDADVVVWIFSNEDWFDKPLFEPTVDVHPNYPSRDPVSALGEFVFRYALPRILRAPPPLDPGQMARGLEMQDQPLNRGVEMLLKRRTRVLLVHWPSAIVADGKNPELARQTQQNWSRFTANAQKMGAHLLDLRGAMGAEIARGQNLYLDGTHPTKQGDAWLAAQIDGALTKISDSRPGQQALKSQLKS